MLRDRFYANHQDIEAFAVCSITAPTSSADAGVFNSFSSEGKYCATLMRRKFNAVRLESLDGDGILYSAGSSTSSKISGHLIMLSGISAEISCSKTSDIDIPGSCQSGPVRKVRGCVRSEIALTPSSPVCVIPVIYDCDRFISLEVLSMID